MRRNRTKPKQQRIRSFFPDLDAGIDDGYGLGQNEDDSGLLFTRPKLSAFPTDTAEIRLSLLQKKDKRTAVFANPRFFSLELQRTPSPFRRVALLDYSMSKYEFRNVIESLKTNTSVRFIKLYCPADDADDTVAPAIASLLSADSNLQGLHITSDHSLHLKIISVLVQALRDNTSLRSLKIFQDGMQSKDVAPLFELFKSQPHLTSISLRSSFFDASLGPMLCCAQSLRRIALPGCPIGDALVDLFRSLKNNQTLTCLNLSCTDATFEAYQELAEMLKINRTVQHLNFSRNPISVFSMEEPIQFADALSECTLTRLFLARCEFSDTMMTHILKAVTLNSFIGVLDLSSNPLTSLVDATRILSDLLRVNSTLQGLSLRATKLLPNELSQIANDLCINTTLHFLDVSWNCFSPATVDSFVRTMRTNSSLTELASDDTIREMIRPALQLNKHNHLKHALLFDLLLPTCGDLILNLGVDLPASVPQPTCSGSNFQISL